MLSSLARILRPAAQENHQPLIQQVIRGLGNDLCRITDLQDRLLPHIELACSYLDQQIRCIPGSFPISGADFQNLDISSKLLGSPEDFSATLGKSLEVKTALSGLARNGHARVHAVLGLRVRSEQQGSGSTTKFTDHTLAILAPTETDTRKFLRDVVFSRIVNNCASFHDGRPESEFRSAANRTGEEKLETLINLLQDPTALFRVEKSGHRIPSMVSPTEGKRHDLELPLLHSSDRRQWIMSVVNFDVAEAMAAQSREPNKHRYIYL